MDNMDRFVNKNNTLMMNFRIEDLEDLPFPRKARNGHSPNKYITVGKSGLYFSKPICSELGLKKGGECALKMSPNGKGIIMCLGGNGFKFGVGSASSGALYIAGKDMVAYIKNKLFDNKDGRLELTYRAMVDFVYLSPRTE